MSLASLCSITKATIQRVNPSQGSAMGQVRTGASGYTTANRGSLPTTSTGRLVPAAGNRRFAYEMHDLETDARWFTITDPQCNEKDQLVIGSDTYFVQNNQNFDLVNRLYCLNLKSYTRQLQ